MRPDEQDHLHLTNPPLHPTLSHQLQLINYGFTLRGTLLTLSNTYSMAFLLVFPLIMLDVIRIFHLQIFYLPLPILGLLMTNLTQRFTQAEQCIHLILGRFQYFTSSRQNDKIDPHSCQILYLDGKHISFFLGYLFLNTCAMCTMLYSEFWITEFYFSKTICKGNCSFFSLTVVHHYC